MDKLIVIAATLKREAASPNGSNALIKAESFLRGDQYRPHVFLLHLLRVAGHPEAQRFFDTLRRVSVANLTAKSFHRHIVANWRRRAGDITALLATSLRHLQVDPANDGEGVEGLTEAGLADFAERPHPFNNELLELNGASAAATKEAFAVKLAQLAALTSTDADQCSAYLFDDTYDSIHAIVARRVFDCDKAIVPWLIVCLVFTRHSKKAWFALLMFFSYAFELKRKFIVQNDPEEQLLVQSCDECYTLTSAEPSASAPPSPAPLTVTAPSQDPPAAAPQQPQSQQTAPEPPPEVKVNLLEQQLDMLKSEYASEM